MKKILFAGAEAMPFAATGGADTLLVLGVGMVRERALHQPLTHRKAQLCP